MSRRDIINSLKAQLKTIPVFSRRIYNQRTQPKTGYPCVALYSASEAITTQTLTLHPRPQQRTLTINISVFAKTTQDDEKLEIDIDNYSELIESVVSQPPGTIDLQLIDINFPPAPTDEEKLEVTETVLVYAITYETTEPN